MYNIAIKYWPVMNGTYNVTRLSYNYIKCYSEIKNLCGLFPLSKSFESFWSHIPAALSFENQKEVYWQL